jgi:hypothetical protein
MPPKKKQKQEDPIKVRYRIIRDIIKEQVAAADYFLNRAPNRKSDKCREKAHLLLDRAIKLDQWLKEDGPTDAIMNLARDLEIGIANRRAVKHCG